MLQGRKVMDAPERTTMTIQGVEYVVIRADLFTALEQELATERENFDNANATAQRLRRMVRAFCPMDCPDCGPYVLVDEDGCCVTCGSDAIDSRALADEREK
jgi:hypothetical protein